MDDASRLEPRSNYEFNKSADTHEGRMFKKHTYIKYCGGVGGREASDGGRRSRGFLKAEGRRKRVKTGENYLCKRLNEGTDLRSSRETYLECTSSKEIIYKLPIVKNIKERRFFRVALLGARNERTSSGAWPPRANSRPEGAGVVVAGVAMKGPEKTV